MAKTKEIKFFRLRDRGSMLKALKEISDSGQRPITHREYEMFRYRAKRLPERVAVIGPRLRVHRRPYVITYYYMGDEEFFDVGHIAAMYLKGWQIPVVQR